MAKDQLHMTSKESKDSKNQLHFKDFNAQWAHVVDPTQVHAVLASVSIPHPERYNQLMVANDINGIAYYAIYASGGHKDKAGAPTHDGGTPFDLVYDRKDLPEQFK